MHEIMSKLGYTWYPKDWTNSESVFQLNLEQRGLYRELIDMVMLNDNKTIINMPVWCRKWDISEDKLTDCLLQLCELKLIIVRDKKLFIPSCEPRLKLVRGGKKGGTKSKPTLKPIGKPTPKGDSNQIETEIETKPKETEIESNNNLSIFDFEKDYKKNEKLIKAIQDNLFITQKQFSGFFNEFKIQYLEPLDEKGFNDAKKHFLNWLKIEIKKEKASGEKEKSNSQIAYERGEGAKEILREMYEKEKDQKNEPIN